HARILATDVGGANDTIRYQDEIPLSLSDLRRVCYNSLSQFAFMQATHQEDVYGFRCLFT
ncbi:MAG: hypothetical protein OES12_09610, partial [Anaerolineae bacterium]|nr:hypothetical protein [Anaerolineae bacterium]